jgi:hypothetical protein
MIRRTMVVVTAVMLAACGSGGAATGQPQAAQATARRLDVAGVRPGMSTDEVRSALGRAGWKVETSPGRDWSAEVAMATAQQKGGYAGDLPRKGVEAVLGHKGDEQLVVSMRAVPTGAAVTTVVYKASMAGRTDPEVRAQMLQRYGRPDRDAGPAVPLLGMVWCTGGERCRDGYGSAKPSMVVEEDVYHRLNIKLFEGSDAEQAWRASVQRAVGGAGAPTSSF